jgi:hypothetical protein
MGKLINQNHNPFLIPVSLFVFITHSILYVYIYIYIYGDSHTVHAAWSYHYDPLNVPLKRSLTTRKNSQPSQGKEDSIVEAKEAFYSVHPTNLRSKQLLSARNFGSFNNFYSLGKEEEERRLTIYTHSHQYHHLNIIITTTNHYYLDS